MPKRDEIAYVANLSSVLGVPRDEVERGLLEKPYNDPNRAHYLVDIAQIVKLLPPPPSRVLDLGAGPGWTSVLLASCGWEVVGTDIAPDMVELARRRIQPAMDLRFEVADFEEPLNLGEFDVVLLYDALHHAVDEGSVIENAYAALRTEGILVTLEPGVGHSEAPETIDVVEKFGTTEKDMPFSHQAWLMRDAGFAEVQRYVRLNQLALVDVEAPGGEAEQRARLEDVLVALRRGHSSIVVARKGAPARDATTVPPPPTARLSRLRRWLGR
jgi:SAM-dependent methyltransferase